MKSKLKTYWKLFYSMLYLSAFTFGGGYVIISLMQKTFVDKYHWMTEEEMLNFTAIAQSSPGAVAVNASILVGYRVCGAPGALIAILGTALPPLVILSVISCAYTAFRDSTVVSAVLKGMQAGVAAVIVDVVWSLGRDVVKRRDGLSIAIMLGSFAAVWALDVNVVWIILVCGVLGGTRRFLEPALFRTGCKIKGAVQPVWKRLRMRRHKKGGSHS